MSLSCGFCTDSIVYSNDKVQYERNVEKASFTYRRFLAHSVGSFEKKSKIFFFAAEILSEILE